MAEIKVKFLKAILDIGITIEEIESFKKDYEIVKGIHTDYMLDTKKIPRFHKRKAEYISFVEKWKELIAKLEEHKILYDMTGFDMQYHWEDTYKDAITCLLNSNKENTVLLFEKLKDNGFSVIHFTKDSFNKVFDNKLRKKYDKEEYELEYYEADVEGKYLAKYYGEYYPVVFKDAKIILKYMNGNVFYNTNEVFLNTFDIDVEKVPFKKDDLEVVNSIPQDEIKKLTAMCEYILDLNKILEQLEKNAKKLKELVSYEDLKDVHWKQFNDIETHIKYFNKIKDDTLNSYYKLGYDKEIIEQSLEYIKSARWKSSIHSSW